MKTVSIIVPIYNCANSISACIESILAQTFKSLDIILIDDGSIDDSYELCIKYKEKDERIRVFQHENKGVSFTRNVGINNALGDYIMFVDADDTVLPDMVERYLSVANQSSADIVLGGIVFSNNGCIEEKMPPKDANSSQSAINYIIQGYRGIFGYVPNKMYKNELLKSYTIRFSEELSNQEDLLFFLEVADVAEKIVPIQYAGYIYDCSLGEKTVEGKVLIKNLIHIIDTAKKYSSIDLSPAKKRLGNMLIESLMTSKKKISITNLKEYVSIKGIRDNLEPSLMKGANSRIVIWLVKHRLLLPLFFYIYIRC